MENDSLSNSPAQSETSVIIGFDIGRTFIFYDPSDQLSQNWASIFDRQPGWKFDQFDDYKKPLGWIAKLSMQHCANLDVSKVTELTDAFKKLGAQLKPETMETIFFAPGVGVLSFQLAFETGEVSWRLNDLGKKDKRKPIRPLLEDLIEAAVNHYTGLLDRKPSLIKSFKAVDRGKCGYPVFFLLSFVDQRTFYERARCIRDWLASTDEQRGIFDERARVGYEGATVFIDWSEALVTGNTANQKKQIETNFIIAMASWSSLSLMERHSAKDSFTALAQAAGANTEPLSVNEVYIRSMAYRDVSDASRPIRWTTNSTDLHLLEAIHRNWSSDRLREVIGERMQAVSVHLQRIQEELQRGQDEQRELFRGRQEVLNQRLTVFAVIVALSALASAGADLLIQYNTTGTSGVLKSLTLPASGVVIFVIVFLWSKHSQNRDGGDAKRTSPAT